VIGEAMLRGRVLAALPWAAGDVLVRQGIQFGATVVLARLLSPDDFGTVALTSLFAAIGLVFVDGGFSAALIQRQEVSEDDKTTAFWSNVAVGLAAGAILVACSWWWAGFYSIRQLQPLMMAAAGTIVLSSLGSTHAALLTKQLAFGRLAFITFVATVASGGIAIVLALRGSGVWALAVQSLAAAGITSGLMWVMSGWRPHGRFSAASVHKLFGFGGFVFAANISDAVYTRAYTVALGRFYSVSDVGLYNRADSTQQTATGVVSRITSMVTFPVFSEIAADAIRLRKWVRAAIQAVMLVNLPILLIAAALAEPLVLTLFGDHWLGAAPVLRLLLIAGAMWPLHVINLNVLMATGHSKQFLGVEIAKKAVGILLLVVGSFFGLLGIAGSQVAFGLVAFLINAAYTRRLIGYGAREQFRDCLPGLTCAVPVAVAASMTASVMSASAWLELLAIGPASAAVYLALMFCCWPDVTRNLRVLLLGDRGGDGNWPER